MKLKDYEVPEDQKCTDMGLYIDTDQFLDYSGVVFGGGSFSLTVKGRVDDVDGTEWFGFRSTQRSICNGKTDVARIGINISREELQELVNELQEVLDQ